MRPGFSLGVFLAGVLTLLGPNAFAQNSTDLPAADLSNEIFFALGVSPPKLTPIRDRTPQTALPVKLLYGGPTLNGAFTLTITVSERKASHSGPLLRPVSQSTLYLKTLSSETEAVVTLAEISDGLQIEAALRDENGNLILETVHSLPVLSRDLRILRLAPQNFSEPTLSPTPALTAIETIAGKIMLPHDAALPPHAVLHIQLVENTLAGGLFTRLAAQESRRAIAENNAISFTLHRGIWDGRGNPDLAFKAWITDQMGRKIFVMSRPVGYNGPEINYQLRLDSLRQGNETTLGKSLDPELRAQTLVQGEAQFDPVRGIPGRARLKITLRQDRGDYNLNPILAEQTLILRGMETRIPFSLRTDSMHFDPYAPAPFLSVTLTDTVGRVYYASGEIRAREDQNSIRLFPR